MNFKVVGIGEVLWDLLPAGRQMGGAPANFSFHARSLGASAAVITRVGADASGRDILHRLREMGFPLETVQVDDEAPTGTVTVTLAEQGVPHFIIHENVAWDRLMVTKAALENVECADAVCFGSLAQRNSVARATIQSLAASAPAQAWRVFDINLRQTFYSKEVIEKSLRLANVLKLNDSELPIVAEMFELEDVPQKQIEQLSQRFDLSLIALTRGAAGSLLYQNGRWSDQPPRPVQVVDTVGAGDSFTAALVMGLLKKMDLDKIHGIAAEVAAYVCSQAGATPALPAQIKNELL